MNDKYRISLKQQMLVASTGLILYSFCIGIYLYFFSHVDIRYFTFPLTFFLLFDILPAVFLHIQYYLANRNSLLEIGAWPKTISYSRNDRQITYPVEEIKEIQYVVSYGGGASAAGWYAFGEYRFCRIIFKDGYSIVVTCLMVHDIMNTLEGKLKIKVDQRYHLIPYLKRSDFRNDLQKL